MYRHLEPVCGLLAGHGLDATGAGLDRGHVAHRRQQLEQQPHRQGFTPQQDRQGRVTVILVAQQLGAHHPRALERCLVGHVVGAS